LIQFIFIEKKLGNKLSEEFFRLKFRRVEEDYIYSVVSFAPKIKRKIIREPLLWMDYSLFTCFE